MKPILVLTTLFAATSAGNIAFSGAPPVVAGFSSANAGYSGGGYQGNVGTNNGGLSGGGIGGFGGGFNHVGAGFGGGGGGGVIDGGFAGNVGGGQIRKFVSVHVGPDEPQITQTKVIRAGGPPDKHVNIIFVKAPSSASQQNTEVILPEQPQQKTLVYVLVKKQESTSNVRVRGPAPTRASKPEVYFIRYKDGQSPTGLGVGSAIGGDASSLNHGPAYGTPSQGPVGLVNGGY